MSQQALIDAIQNLTDQMDQDRSQRESHRRRDDNRRRRDRRERERNTNALTQLSNSIVSFYNPVNQLKKAVMDSDKITVKALASNFNLTKVLDKNSDILSETTANIIEFKSALQDAYSRGVRESTESMNKLTERMIKTGQDTTRLNMLNAELARMTGGNTETLDKNAKNIEKYGKIGQVSNQKLIESLQSLSKERDELAFFGPQAVEGINRAITSIRSRTGVDTTDQISQIVSLIQPTLENNQKLTRLGFDATALFNQISQGQNVERILLKVSDRITELTEQQGSDALISRLSSENLTDLSIQQLRAAQDLSRNSKNQLKLDKEAATKAGDEDTSIKAIRDASLKYYNKIAPEIRDGIVSMGEQLAIMLPLLGAGKALGGLTGGVGLGGGGRGRRRGMIRSGKFAIGSIAAGIGLGLVDDIAQSQFGAKEGGTLDKVTNVGEKAAEFASYGALAGTVVPGLGNAIGVTLGGLYGAGVGVFEEFFSEEAIAREEQLKESEKQTKILEEQNRREEKQAEASKVQQDAQYLANAIRNNAPAHALDQREIKILLSAIASNTIPQYSGKGMIPEDQ